MVILPLKTVTWIFCYQWIGVELWKCTSDFSLMQSLLPIGEPMLFVEKTNDFPVASIVSLTVLLFLPDSDDVWSLMWSLSNLSSSEEWFTGLVSIHVIHDCFGDQDQFRTGFLRFRDIQAAGSCARACIKVNDVPMKMRNVVNDVLPLETNGSSQPRASLVINCAVGLRKFTKFTKVRVQPPCRFRCAMLVDDGFFFGPRDPLPSKHHKMLFNSNADLRLSKDTPICDRRDRDVVKQAEDEIPPSRYHAHLRELPRCVFCLNTLDCFDTPTWRRIVPAPLFKGSLSWPSKHPQSSECATCIRLDVNKDKAKCASCGDDRSVWICIVCGHIGCGRYSNEHAKNHFQVTGHSLSIELATRRIWDYANDTYVHRLGTTATHPLCDHCVQNEQTPQKHEVLSAVQNLISQDTYSRTNMHLELTQQKLLSLASHYENILRIQLVHQRRHYDEVARQHLCRPNTSCEYVYTLDAVRADLCALQAKHNEALRLSASAELKNKASLSWIESMKASFSHCHAQLSEFRKRVAISKAEKQRQVCDLLFCIHTRLQIDREAAAGSIQLPPGLSANAAIPPRKRLPKQWRCRTPGAR